MGVRCSHDGRRDEYGRKCGGMHWIAVGDRVGVPFVVVIGTKGGGEI
jgi:hypothetical protein